MHWHWSLVLFAGCLLGCGGKPNSPPIVVGHVATLSGPDQRAGQQAMRGIKLALEDINSNEEQRRIEVRHTDTLGNIDAFESESIRLVSINGARALLGGNTPDEVAHMCRAVPPDTKEQPVFVPILSPCGWRSSLMTRQAILSGMTPQAEGRVLARFAVDKDLEHALLLVNQGDDRAVAAADAFQREFVDAWRRKSPDREPNSPSRLVYGAGTKLWEVLAQLDLNRPHAVFVAGSRADLRQVHEKFEQHLSKQSDQSNKKVDEAEPKQAKPGDTIDSSRKPALKPKSPPAPILLFSGPDGSLQPDDWPLLTSNGAAPSIYFASAFGLEKDNAAVEDFAKRFRQQFQDAPDVHAALAYEAMKLLAEPLRTGPATSSVGADAVKLREELFKIKDFPSFVGPVNFIKEEGIVRPLYVLRLEREQSTVMNKYVP